MCKKTLIFNCSGIYLNPLPIFKLIDKYLIGFWADRALLPSHSPPPVTLPQNPRKSLQLLANRSQAIL